MTVRSSIVALLAHQGGWDEVALVGGPIVVIAGLLMLAKRRVDAAGAPSSSRDESGVSSRADSEH